MKLSTFELFKHIHTEKGIRLTDAMVKELQQVLLTMLDDIVSVCEKNNLTYTLGGGSCLGALRHRGFIPWDDDIDINMPRADYERFIPVFKETFGWKYWVHTPDDTDNYGLLTTRIRLKGTVIKSREDFFNSECGVPLDLFIIENTFDNAILRFVHGWGCMAFGFLLSCRKFWRDRKVLLELAGDDNSVRRIFKIKVAIGCLTSVGSVNFWTRAANRWNRLCKNNRSKWVCCPSGRKHFRGELYERAHFLTPRKCSFEGRDVNIPIAAEEYMVHLYGDWQTIPPKEDIESHYCYEFKL